MFSDKLVEKLGLSVCLEGHRDFEGSALRRVLVDLRVFSIWSAIGRRKVSVPSTGFFFQDVFG